MRSLQKLVAQAESDREREIAAAEEKYRRRMEAIRVIFEMEGGENGNAENRESDEDSRTTLPHRGELVASVKQAAQSITGPFSLHQVVEYIVENRLLPADSIKLASISSALKRLQKDEVVEVIAPGGGKRPTVYRRMEAMATR